MSELKAYTYDDMIDGDADTNIEYYPKSEADKVIADKDKEIAELKKQIHNYTLGLFVIQAKAGKELLHSNYKRCLAMAKWCKMSARENDTRMCLPMKCKLTRHEEYLYFIGYYHKWHRRWLELAEKFKEVK